MALDDYIKERQDAAAAATDPNVDPTADPVVDPATGPVVDPQNTDGSDPVIDPAAVAVELEDEQLNSFFETTGKTKEDIKGVYSLGSKYSELETKSNEYLQELDTIKQQNAELKKGLDPLSYFSSEQTYIAEQLRKKYPTMDPVAIQTAITKDISEMSDIDVLALQDVIKRPGISGGESMSKKLLANKYGIDLSEPASEWDELARGALQRDAYDARQELNTFKSEVELPSIKTEEELQAERAKQTEDLKAQWAPVLPKLQAFDKITIPGKEEGQGFEFEVPQEFRDGLGDYFEAMIVNGELQPNEETVKFMMVQREKDFIHQNLSKIYTAIEADLSAKIKSEADALLNNTDPANTQTRTPDGQVIGGTEAHLAKQPGRNRRI